jgi:cysteine desulfurase
LKINPVGLDRPIYADFNASAPLSKKVKLFLEERMQNGLFGNPNALHAIGNSIKLEIETTREKVADLLGADPEQVIFNSGSSEGIATVFHQFYLNRPLSNLQKKWIVTSKLEHAAVLNSIENLSDEKKIEPFFIPINHDGTINLSEFKLFTQKNYQDIGMIACMSVNNETGVIQPLEDLVELAKQYQLPFFSDTTQHIGRLPFHFQKSKLDFAVASGHKLGAPFGCGILLCKNPSLLRPLIYGGEQEKGLRGGTQNYLGILALGIALEENCGDAKSLETWWGQILSEKLNFEQKLKKRIPSLVIFGDQAERLPNTTCLSFPGLHGQGIQIECESNNLFVTTSAACSDNEPETSLVLKAMGANDALGRGAIRISSGKSDYAHGDYERIFDILLKAAKHFSYPINEVL